MKRYLLLAIFVSAACAVFPQKGNIGFVYPCGAARGTTVEVTVGGQNLSRAEGIVVSGAGVKGELVPLSEGQPKKKRKGRRNIGEEDNLQLADQVRFRLTVAPDAEPGLRDLRLLLPNGMTNRLYFEVGELPDVLGKEPDDEQGTFVETLPATLNGQVMRSDADRFRFRARKGQTLVARAKGRLFVPYLADAVPGWFQPVMRIYDSRMKEVAYNDDYRYQVDPVILFDVPEDGEYTVEIRDALHRGREDFVYRIDLGELPFITSIYPLGGTTGRKSSVMLRGVNLPGTALKLKPAEEGRIPVSVRKKNGPMSNTVYFESGPEVQRYADLRRPNFTIGQAAEIGLGEVFNAVVDRPMRVHWYRIDVPARQPVVFEVMARRLGSPADMRMTLYDSRGKVLADVDDTPDKEEYLLTHHADPQIIRRFRQEETCFLRLIESQGKGGEEYAYRLKVGRAEADFALNIEPATVSVARGGSGVLNVIALRKQQFRGPIDLHVEGLPEGFRISSARIPQGSQRLMLTVTALEGADTAVVQPKIYGTAEGEGGRVVRRDARPVETMMQAFYYTHLMPIDEFRLEVTDRLPFSLSVAEPERPLSLSAERKVPLTVRIRRDEGYDEPITLMLRSSERGVKAEAVVVGPGQSEAVLEIECKSARQRAVPTQLVVSGVVKASSKRIAGQARNAFVAAVSAFTPAVTAMMPVSPKQPAKRKPAADQPNKEK